MTIRIENIDPCGVTIAVSGPFNHRVEASLRYILPSLDTRPHVCFDCTHTTELHSTGLYLLIRLRQQFGGRRASVSLKNCNAAVMQVLRKSGMLPLLRVTPVINHWCLPDCATG